MNKNFSLKDALKDNSSRHVLGLSGGKDSAALAIHIKQNYPELHEKVEYFFSDTGAELDEVYEFLQVLESYLGKEIIRIGSDKPFKHWLKVNNNFLPSPRQRWCTVKMKLQPFEEFVGDDPVISYIVFGQTKTETGTLATRTISRQFFPLRKMNWYGTTSIGYWKKL